MRNFSSNYWKFLKFFKFSLSFIFFFLQSISMYDDGEVLSKALLNTEDRKLLVLLEDEFIHLVTAAAQECRSAAPPAPSEAECNWNVPKKRRRLCVIFPPMNSYQRLLVHKTAERFRLKSQSEGMGIERRTIVTTTAKSQLYVSTIHFNYRSPLFLPFLLRHFSTGRWHDIATSHRSFMSASLSPAHRPTLRAHHQVLYLFWIINIACILNSLHTSIHSKGTLPHKGRTAALSIEAH